MGGKRERQRVLTELLDTHEFCSQAEVRDALAERGFDVHQGTVSRDLAELGATRTLLDSNLARELESSEARDVYFLPPDAHARSQRQAAARLDAILRQHATAVQPVEALPYVLVLTEPGRSLRVARAIVASEIPEVIAALPAPGDRVLVLLDNGMRSGPVAARLAAAGQLPASDLQAVG